MASKLDQVSQAIGALQAQTTLLIAAQEAHSDSTARVQAQLQTLTASVAVIQKDVAAFAPAAKKIRKWEQRAIGMSFIGGIVGSWLLAHIKGWFL